MKRSRLTLSLALLGLAACSAHDATAPASAPQLRPQPEAAASYYFGGAEHDGHVVPGSLGNAGSAPASGAQHRLLCNISAPLTGRATIGPNGGFLFVGPD